MCCRGQNTGAMGAVGRPPSYEVAWGRDVGGYYGHSGGTVASSPVDDLLTNSSRDFCNYPHILYG
jgi:hypothetical protein